MSHESQLDTLAARARQDLNRVTTLRPVPPPRKARTQDDAAPMRAVPRVLRKPAVAALAVAVFVLGVLVGIGSVRDRSLDSGVLASVAVGNRPVSVATDGRTAWVADEATGRVFAVDVDRLVQRWAVDVGPRPVAVASGFGAIWVVDAGDRQLRQLSPTDGKELRRANTSLDPIAVVTADRVWVLSFGNATADGYDPTALRQDRAGRGLSSPTAIAAGTDQLWVVAGGYLYRLPPTGGDAVRVQGGASVELVAANQDAVWVTDADGILLTVDPASGTVTNRVALPARATAISAGPVGAVVATRDGTVTWIARPGSEPVIVSRTGAALTSLALVGRRVLGTSPDSGLLYRMEVPS
jgi:hypothetical protein